MSIEGGGHVPSRFRKMPFFVFPFKNVFFLIFLMKKEQDCAYPGF